MSLSSLNITQEAQALNALFKSTATSVAPLLLFESFVTGILCAGVPIGSAKPFPFPRAPSISMLWIVLTVTIVHWALSLRQLESTLSGRSLGASVTQEALGSAVFADPTLNETDYSWSPQPYLLDIQNTYYIYGEAWQYLLPLITETVLFGFASFLFALTAYTSFQQLRSGGRSCSSLVIPAMASVMYMLSLAHWAVFLHCFAEYAKLAPTGTDFIIFLNDSDVIQIASLTLFSLNAIMSDSIVLWRMCAVWERARTIFAFGAAMLVTTLGLNIANIVEQASLRLRHGQTLSGVTYNTKDFEVIVTYGSTSIGLAAAFVSLASNLCATALVGLKIWVHRRNFPMHAQSGNRRTMVERVMELLVDSGIVYTAIWLLYCTSFYRQITSQVVLGPAASEVPGPFVAVVTAVNYLDAAMAQITSIYPLIVFILVAADKIHHSRGPRVLRNEDWPKERSPVEAVTVTFEIDIERSRMLVPDSAHPMAERSEDDPGKVAGIVGGEEKHGAVDV
ncbi:hypothetical protein PENSPDRAFT_760281 [Peniophora sp. CONT]|nr:hypothetical protein PENSPDRAFT_760281 [Peniophora sp. CONT]